jgi:hypothetical protein
MSSTRTPADHAVILTALAGGTNLAGGTCAAFAVLQPAAQALAGAGLRGERLQAAGEQLAHGPVYLSGARGSNPTFVIGAEELARLLDVNVGPPCELTAVQLPHIEQRQLFLDEDQALAYANCHPGATVTGEVVIDHTTAARMIAAAQRELEQATAELACGWIGQEVIDATDPTAAGRGPSPFTMTSIGSKHGEPTLEGSGHWCYLRNAERVPQPTGSAT